MDKISNKLKWITGTILLFLPSNVFAKALLIDEDRVWLYRVCCAGGPWEGYEFQMKFDGVTKIDGKTYHNLKTINGRGFLYEGPSSQPEVVDIPDGLTFLLREEDGRVYRHAPIEDTNENGPIFWDADESEALLYDFNAMEGDLLTVIDSWGSMVSGSVTDTSVMQIGGEDCRSYVMTLGSSGVDVTVIEGIGNISYGCLPYLDTDMAASGAISGYIPEPCRGSMLSKVFDASGNVIFENENGIPSWPWEETSVVAIGSNSSSVYYSAGIVRAADGAEVAVYDMAGKRVAQGRGSLSTASLQPGVYIVKAAAAAIKITVK